MPTSAPTCTSRDRVAGTTKRISVAHDGGETQNNSDSPDVAVGAGGGAIVAFASSADNLVANDANDASDVFVRDLTGAAPTTEWVSVTSDEQPPEFVGGFGFGSRSPSISPDGRFVAFSSDAVNFTTPVQEGIFFDVYVRDRQAGRPSSPVRTERAVKRTARARAPTSVRTAGSCRSRPSPPIWSPARPTPTSCSRTPSSTTGSRGRPKWSAWPPTTATPPSAALTPTPRPARSVPTVSSA